MSLMKASQSKFLSRFYYFWVSFQCIIFMSSIDKIDKIRLSGY